MARTLTLNAGAYMDVISRPVSAQPRGERVASAAEPIRRGNLPERTLLVAVLTGAVNDLLDQRSRDRQSGAALHDLARQWIEGAPAAITFADCCEALGFDVGATRAALLNPRHPRRSSVLFEIGATRAA